MIDIIYSALNICFAIGAIALSTMAICSWQNGDTAKSTQLIAFACYCAILAK